MQSQNPKSETNCRRIYLTPKDMLWLSRLVKCVRGVQESREKVACFTLHILKQGDRVEKKKKRQTAQRQGKQNGHHCTQEGSKGRFSDAPTCRYPPMQTPGREGGIFLREGKGSQGHCPSQPNRVVPAALLFSVSLRCCPQRRHHLPCLQSRSLCFPPACWRISQLGSDWNSSPVRGTYADCWCWRCGRRKKGNATVFCFLRCHGPLCPPARGYVQRCGFLLLLMHSNSWKGKGCRSV